MNKFSFFYACNFNDFFNCRKGSLPETTLPEKVVAGNGHCRKRLAGNVLPEKGLPEKSLPETGGPKKVSLYYRYSLPSLKLQSNFHILYFFISIFCSHCNRVQNDVYVNVNKLLFAVQQNAKRKYYQCLFAIFLSVPYFCSLVIISDIFNP